MEGNMNECLEECEECPEYCRCEKCKEYLTNIFLFRDLKGGKEDYA